MQASWAESQATTGSRETVNSLFFTPSPKHTTENTLKLTEYRILSVRNIIFVNSILIPVH
jgi:hypothetical protein